MKNNTEFDAFFCSYIDCSLWSSIDEADEPLSTHYTIDDIEERSLEILKAHALSFWSRANYLIDIETVDAPQCGWIAQAGHDLWLTQNVHGAGYWDGGWPIMGERLTNLAECYPEISFVVHDGSLVAV